MNRCDVRLKMLEGDLSLLPEGRTVELAGFAKALSDPIRIQMIHLLEQRPDLCTCEFEELLGLSQSKVSYHLRILFEAGLVARTVAGTWSHYSLRSARTLDQLEEIMTNG